MTFLSVYNLAIKPAACWCDNLHKESKKSSSFGQLEAEVLARVVCLSAIATGSVLVPVDIALTALIGVGTFACAVFQTRCFYKKFRHWRKATEIEAIFLMMVVNSGTSLARSIFRRSTSFKRLKADASELRDKNKDQPIYSRSNAITQLFYFSPRAFCAFTIGCISVPFDLITLGYFRKWEKSILPIASSLPLYLLVARVFHTLFCLIHIAKPKTIRYSKLLWLAEQKEWSEFDTTLLEKPASESFFFFDRCFKCWTCRSWSKKPINTVVLVSRDSQRLDFAVNKDHIVLAKQQDAELPNGKQVTKWFLKNELEIDLQIDENGYLVSKNPDYAVLGSLMDRLESLSDGQFILNGGATVLNAVASTMHGAQLLIPKT